jgi:hypothetical protein
MSSIYLIYLLIFIEQPRRDGCRGDVDGRQYRNLRLGLSPWHNRHAADQAVWEVLLRNPR